MSFIKYDIATQMVISQCNICLNLVTHKYTRPFVICLNCGSTVYEQPNLDELKTSFYHLNLLSKCKYEKPVQEDAVYTLYNFLRPGYHLILEYYPNEYWLVCNKYQGYIVLQEVTFLENCKCCRVHISELVNYIADILI